VHHLQKNYTEAINLFYKALNVSAAPEDLNHRIDYRLGEAFFYTRQYAEAASSLEECLELCPNHRAAKSLLEKTQVKIKQK
jgi:tetratricopeptide (TPR) repeat protein